MSSLLDPSALLKRARKRAGLSQRALARRADTSQSVVARIELGTTSPTVSTLNRLLAAADQEVVVRLHGSARGEGPDAASIARRIRAFFESHPAPGIVSVYLFGSTARGQRHAESDVDVAALLDRSIHADRGDRSELRIRLGARLIGEIGVNEVDLVILNDIPPGLARKIVLDGKRLYCADPETDHAFVRDVQLRYADLRSFLERTAAVKLEALVS